MTVPAVRTTLSKEGFRLQRGVFGGDAARADDPGAALSPGDALIWLSRRRGYIPNRAALAPHEREAVVTEIVADRNLDFPTALERILRFTGTTPTDLSRATGRPAAWVAALTEGAAVETDLPALRAMALALTAPEPDFVAQAVRHLLRLEAGGNPAPTP